MTERSYAEIGGGLTGLSVVSAPAWTPADLGAALKCWWDFSDTATITESSGAVSSVTDKSGGGFTLTGTGTAKPTTGTRTINSLNTLDFDGTDDKLTLASNPMSGASAGHAFYVFALDADPPGTAAKTGPVLGLWDTEPTFESHEPYSDGNIYHAWGSNARKTIGNPTPALTTPRQIDVWSASADYGWNVDAASIFTTGTNTVGFGASPQVGASTRSGGPVFLDGRIAEIFVTNAKLTGTDLTSARGYLKARWATP